MSRATITVQLDSDAFQPNPDLELTRILYMVCRDIEQVGLSGLAGGSAYLDGNGKPCAMLEVTQEEES